MGRVMSLTSFLDMRDVIERVKPLRPTSPRKIDSMHRVEPRSNRYTLVGTAFDYLLRFEIQRRAPHAISEGWVAEHAAGVYCVGEATVLVRRNDEDAKEVQKRARIVEDAKAALAVYLKTKKPERIELAELAAHAIRLAGLDTIVRTGRRDLWLKQVASEDVEDLLSMLQIVPFDFLLHSKPILLNPTFGEASGALRGADADLITGDLLVDFKATTKNTIDSRDLDQLLGYFLLGRRQRRVDTTFPEIRRVAIYFCRHGYLWTLDATVWTGHPEFPAVEEWFFQRAKEVFPPIAPLSSRSLRKPRPH